LVGPSIGLPVSGWSRTFQHLPPQDVARTPRRGYPGFQALPEPRADLNDERRTPSWWRPALFLVGVVALAFGFAAVNTLPVGVFHDDAMYVILARSLATGQGYRYLNLPGNPAATHFPPGYPAFL